MIFQKISLCHDNLCNCILMGRGRQRVNEHNLNSIPFNKDVLQTPYNQSQSSFTKLSTTTSIKHQINPRLQAWLCHVFRLDKSKEINCFHASQCIDSIRNVPGKIRKVGIKSRRQGSRKGEKEESHCYTLQNTYKRIYNKNLLHYIK